MEGRIWSSLRDCSSSRFEADPLMESRVLPVGEEEAKFDASSSQKHGITGETGMLEDLYLDLDEKVPVMQLAQEASATWMKNAISSMNEMWRRENRHMAEILILRAENKKLECARMRAEMETDCWKKKYEELESRNLENMNTEHQSGDKVGWNKSERPKVTDHRGEGCGACLHELPMVMKLDETLKNRIQAPTLKRKRMSAVVMSDSDTEDTEDESEDIPTEETQTNNVKDVKDRPSSSSSFSVADDSNEDGKTVSRSSSRRHLVPSSQLRDLGNKGNARRRLSFPILRSSDNDDEDGEPTESDSEGDSLDGFIAYDSDTAVVELSDSSSSEYEGSSNSSGDRIFERIQRGSSIMKWEYEGDMLASFGKDPVMCMKAVCALYRQQTADEKSFKGSLLTNNRGFNKIDAKRASYIAEFLTDGDAAGPLVKSMEDLQAYDPGGVEYCYKLAAHYSKQLFMIYQSGEDPHYRAA